MTAALQWASQSAVDPAQRAALTEQEELLGQTRPVNQVLRLNAFISLAMSEIEQIRVEYRPNGYWCNVPFVRLIIGKKCTPVRVAS